MSNRNKKLKCFFNLSHFGMYLKYNYVMRFIMKVCYIGFSFYSFLNSISSNFIFFVFHQKAETLLIQDKFLVPLSIYNLGTTFSNNR